MKYVLGPGHLGKFWAIVFGLGAGVLIGDKFYVEPGVQFVRRTKTITSETEQFDFGQNSVKIPVYAGYHILGHEKDRLH